jgi:hypothetical protein
MRRVFLFGLLSYVLLFGLCLLYSFCEGLKTSASSPAILMGAPWTYLARLIDPNEDYLVDCTWENLSGTGILIVIISGLLNAAILWMLSRIVRRPN